MGQKHPRARLLLPTLLAWLLLRCTVFHCYLLTCFIRKSFWRLTWWDRSEIWKNVQLQKVCWWDEEWFLHDAWFQSEKQPQVGQRFSQDDAQKKTHALNGHHNPTVLRWQTYSSLNQLTTSYLHSVKTLLAMPWRGIYIFPAAHPSLPSHLLVCCSPLSKAGSQTPGRVPPQVFAPNLARSLRLWWCSSHFLQSHHRMWSSWVYACCFLLLQGSLFSCPLATSYPFRKALCPSSPFQRLFFWIFQISISLGHP